MTPLNRVILVRGEDTKRNLKHVGYLFSLVKARRKLLTAGQQMHAVVTAKVRQLRIDVRIKPIGVAYRRFKVIKI